MELEEWISKNPDLSNLLVEIQEMDKSIIDQAKSAFHKIAKLLNVPKMPEDINYDDYDDNAVVPVSIYQNLGLIKYLQPDVDPRGQVLSAIYYSINGWEIDINEAFEKKFGKRHITDSGIGFINEGYDVEIVFVDKNQSWFDLGCKLYLRNP